MMRSIFVSAAALVLSGCFASFDRSKAIEVEPHWYGATYAQAEGPLFYWGMMNALESEEAARPHVERWRRNSYGTIATAVAAGASAGVGINVLASPGGNRKVGWSLVGVGIGLLIPMQIMSSAQLSAAGDAVGAHNSLLGGRAPAAERGLRPGSPWVALFPDGRGGTTQAAGLAGVF
jgi:hypothetical protein